MAALQGVTWPMSVDMCTWVCRESQVVVTAIPTLPPTLRRTLKSPLAVGSSAWDTAVSVIVVRGTNTSPMPNPWTNRGQSTAQKSAPRLRVPRRKRE